MPSIKDDVCVCCISNQKLVRPLSESVKILGRETLHEGTYVVASGEAYDEVSGCRGARRRGGIVSVVCMPKKIRPSVKGQALGKPWASHAPTNGGLHAYALLARGSAGVPI